MAEQEQIHIDPEDSWRESLAYLGLDPATHSLDFSRAEPTGHVCRFRKVEWESMDRVTVKRGDTIVGMGAVDFVDDGSFKPPQFFFSAFQPANPSIADPWPEKHIPEPVWEKLSPMIQARWVLLGYFLPPPGTDPPAAGA